MTGWAIELLFAASIIGSCIWIVFVMVRDNLRMKAFQKMWDGLTQEEREAYIKSHHERERSW